MGQVLPWLPLGSWLTPLVQRVASEGDSPRQLPFPRTPLRPSMVELSEDPTTLLVTCRQMGDGFVSSKRQDEGTGA